MELLKIVNNLFRKDATIDQAPRGYCPQCWGRQEYAGKFYNAIYREGINAKNIHQKKGWIVAYVEQHLTGIKLKEVNGVKECSLCNTSYQQT